MTDSNRWYWLTLIVIGGLLVYLLAPVLTPFMIAAILAYIGDPLVDKLEKYKLPRLAAVAIVFVSLTLLASLALLILIPLLENQFVTLSQKVPGYIEVIQQQFIPWLNTRFDLAIKIDSVQLQQTLTENWNQAGSFAGKLASYLTHSGFVLLEVAANLVLIPVVTFYLMRDWDVLVARVSELLPRKTEPVVSLLAKETNVVLGSFLRGQLLVMFSLSLIYSVGLGIVGLDVALLVGLTAGLVSFVPYLGFIVGIVITKLH